jgi:predicted DNA-binding transcriptional regulator YafY
MNDTERIYHIHHRMEETRSAIPKRQLMAELEVSERTIARDIETLRDRLGAPLIYDRKQGGYRYDSHQGSFELPGFWFRADELYALLAASHLFDALQPGLLTDHLRPLRKRIDQLLEHSGHSHEKVDERVILKSVAHRPTGHDQFARIADATLHGTPLRIDYHARGSDQRQSRQVHPCRLLHYRDNWYLVAWCEERQALRNFALERIRQAEVLNTSPRDLPPESIDQHINDAFGIFGGEGTHRAHLAFTPHRARWVAEESWHPDQIGQWQGDRYHLIIPYANPTELVMEIMKHGKEVEVIEPPELRDAVAQALRQAAEQYAQT